MGILQTKMFPTAYKITVQELLRSAQKSAQDNTIITSEFVNSKGQIIERVNIIAIIVSQTPDQKEFVIDDGTGAIRATSFEKKIIHEFQIGDTILMIGRMREINNEKFLSIEIMRPVTLAWMAVRKKELENEFTAEIPAEIKQKTPEISTQMEIQNNLTQTFEQKIIEKIQQLDTGEGVLLNDLLIELNTPLAEETIKKMLANGTIYEPKSGRIKILA